MPPCRIFKNETGVNRGEWQKILLILIIVYDFHVLVGAAAAIVVGYELLRMFQEM